MADRKKSWREIDRGRDRSSHRPDDRERGSGKSQRLESATASYRRSLDAFFDKGKASDFIKDKLARAGVEADAPSERTLRLRAIRAAKSGKPLERAIDDLRAEHPLPDDLQILLRCLEHPSDAILLEALGLILPQVELGNPLPSAKTFVQRLKGVELSSFDPRVQRKAARILKTLAS